MANKLTDSSLWCRKKEKNKTISLIIHIVHTSTQTNIQDTTSGCRNKRRLAPNEMKWKNKVFQLKIRNEKYIYNTKKYMYGAEFIAMFFQYCILYIKLNILMIVTSKIIIM